MAGDRVRRPNSQCFLMSTWTPIAATVKSGRRRPAPGSKGVVDVWFKRNPSKYHYTLATPFSLNEWQLWFKSGRSSGSRWNARYLGRV